MGGINDRPTEIDYYLTGCLLLGILRRLTVQDSFLNGIDKNE